MVFQRFNLFPHMTALENIIEAPIQVRGTAARRGRGHGPGPARAGRAGGQGEGLPEPAVRRPAAARGHRAGPGHEAGPDALRRAHLRPGPRDDRRGAGGHEGAGARGHDDDRGQPRDGLRPRGGQPRRDDGRGRGRRGGHARPDLLRAPPRSGRRRSSRRSCRAAGARAPGGAGGRRGARGGAGRGGRGARGPGGAEGAGGRGGARGAFGAGRGAGGRGGRGARRPGARRPGRVSAVVPLISVRDVTSLLFRRSPPPNAARGSATWAGCSRDPTEHAPDHPALPEANVDLARSALSVSVLPASSPHYAALRYPGRH